jgi:crotonobetainyl-CoA:carnitine CoA-transferase CaiB-like acyl-CoA transferase
MSSPERPLSGVRVIDFTAYASGPYCTLMLAQLGAEVIRIESRSRLDLQRRPHPLYGRMQVPNFDHLAGRKKSVTLNLKSKAGIELVRSLIAVSDVVVENFRPGVMERLGLAWSDLKKTCPSLVMVSISAYGQAGPDSRRPGYAPIFAAEGGLGYVSGYPDGPPIEVRNQMDHQAGLAAAIATVALLEERELSGVGGHCDLAAAEVASMLVGESILKAIADGGSERVGNGHEVWSPHGIFPAAGDDRWIAIAVRSDTEWQALASVTGIEGWQREDWRHAAGRAAAREVIERELSAWTVRQDARALADLLQQAGVCAEMSMSAADLMDDAHLNATDGFANLSHPVYGQRRTVQTPWLFAGVEVDYDSWSPDLGENNEDVICGLLGHGKEQLRMWIEQQVVY